MRGFAVLSPVTALVLILLLIAGVTIALSLVGFGLGAAMLTGIASVLVAAFGIVTAPLLASRSGRGSVVCTGAGLVGVVIAALLLLTSPPSNSNLWVPINLGRFGGVLVAELGLALSLHAAVLGRLGPRRAVVLVSANVLALAIGVLFADWETRDLRF